ncbi:hypothetical protein C942_01455 [Photobacterium marinum]|uniref:Uncharacterized protein n=1 Tax=Photobacterium marinum TaxID=1056511 RepID=L8JF82_9GAMM|nr:hypothetical protein C942_01455 [Photobacterium marinum]
MATFFRPARKAGTPKAINPVSSEQILKLVSLSDSIKVKKFYIIVI